MDHVGSFAEEDDIDSPLHPQTQLIKMNFASNAPARGGEGKRKREKDAAEKHSKQITNEGAQMASIKGLFSVCFDLKLSLTPPNERGLNPIPP